MSRNNKDTFHHDLYYHVYNKVVSGEVLFREESEYHEFLKRYTRYFFSYFETYAYCLIPNHFHFLVKVKSTSEVSECIKNEDTNAARAYLAGNGSINSLIESQFSRCFSGVSKIYNNKYNREGPLFKEGIKRVALNKTRTIMQQMHYIHYNPIHHQSVKNIHDWPNSSYISYLSNKETRLPRKKVFEMFSGKENLIAFHEKPYVGDLEFD